METELRLGPPGNSGEAERTTYVKVGVDGTPFLRKLELGACDGYAGLSAAICSLFGMSEAARDDLTLVYEDKDGDWLLVGDVPWKMFTATCKRVRGMRKSKGSRFTLHPCLRQFTFFGVVDVDANRTDPTAQAAGTGDRTGGGLDLELREGDRIDLWSKRAEEDRRMDSEAAIGRSPKTEISELGFEETELKLALPGGGSRAVSTAGVVEIERKRAFSEGPVLADGPMDSSASPSAKPLAKAQVVGWPPVRSFRKNAMKSCRYVKVAVDGAPYLRKVDLELYTGYKPLLSALEDMFSRFTVCNYPDETRLVDTSDGTEYVPTYEDKDGDWMLVGDVPWKMFVESCKRLRLMKSTEAVNLATTFPLRSSAAS
ncbi:auxin-responsive protein IAA1-like [Wolffia australiana]